jgi:hypothetical protein
MRALALLLAFVTLLAAPGALGQSQSRDPDLTDLWGEYPLDQTPAGVDRLQSRERDGSTAGPPPRAPQPGGPIALAILYVMLALAAVTAVLALRRVVHLPRDILGRLGRERTR